MFRFLPRLTSRRCHLCSVEWPGSPRTLRDFFGKDSCLLGPNSPGRVHGGRILNVWPEELCGPGFLQSLQCKFIRMQQDDRSVGWKLLGVAKWIAHSTVLRVVSLPFRSRCRRETGMAKRRWRESRMCDPFRKALQFPTEAEITLECSNWLC